MRNVEKFIQTATRELDKQMWICFFSIVWTIWIFFAFDHFYNTKIPAFFAVLIMLCLLICGDYAGEVASEKGHSKNEWIGRGIFAGPLALIAACGLLDKLMYKRLKEIEKLELL